MAVVQGAERRRGANVGAAAMIVAAIGGGSVCAQPIAERPEWKIGDTWNFQRKQEPGGVLDKWSRTIIDRLPDGGYTLMASVDRKWQTDADLNTIAIAGPEYRSAWWHWPLRVGETWAYDAKVVVQAGNSNDSVKREVKAFERIRVPAGEFECFRIESTWTRFSYDPRQMSRPNYSSSTDYVNWYCPAIRFIAREETLWRDGYGNTTRTVSELTSYGPIR
jgi:hypothetical protein